MLNGREAIALLRNPIQRAPRGVAAVSVPCRAADLCRLGAGGGGEAGDLLDRLLDLLGGDQPGAFELSRRSRMPRAPQKIVMVEAMVRVVPAAVAGVVVDDPVGRRRFVSRRGETADRADRDVHRLCE